MTPAASRPCLEDARGPLALARAAARALRPRTRGHAPVRPQRGARRVRSSSAAPAWACPAPSKPVMDPDNAAPHPARRAVRRPDPRALPRGDGATSASRGWSRARTAAAASRRSRTPDDVIKLAGPPRLLRPDRGVRRARQAGRGARHHDAARHGRRASTRCARPASRSCRPSARTHDRQVPARPLAAARGAARRDRRHLRQRLPRRRPLRRRVARATTRGRAAASSGRCWRTCGASRRTRDAAARSAAAPATLDELLQREPYEFDRRFLFRVLAMGHSQFAEYIGARGPEHARQRRLRHDRAGASPWPRTGSASGRCRRVIVLGADDVTSDHLMRVDRRRLPGHGRGRHRRPGRGGRAALRPPPPRHAARHGRLRAGGRERGRGARSAACAASSRC